ncbi:hypothetical protein [Pseudomonas aeruginosa]|uniref:hypothetical protein n=1 Tax=Pseudomonas aeruginosa TaxID=287 RepID=UPI003CFD3F17
MADYFEIDFLGVETAKSGDAITLRYSVNGTEGIHVVDGGYLDTGDQIVEHLKTYYGTTVIDHVILTHRIAITPMGFEKSWSNVRSGISGSIGRGYMQSS